MKNEPYITITYPTNGVPVVLSFEDKSDALDFYIEQADDASRGGRFQAWCEDAGHNYFGEWTDEMIFGFAGHDAIGFTHGPASEVLETIPLNDKHQLRRRVEVEIGRYN